MRKFLSFMLSLGLFMSQFTAFILPTFAATPTKVDHFEITVNPTAKVGEAVDIGVKAVDNAGSVVKDYVGTIYITVENDTKATVPYEEGYTFISADQGAKTFSKGLVFSKEGNMKVTVVDIDTENLEGTANVTVSSGDATPSTAAAGNENVTISSPSNGDIIPDTKTTISGTTKKNSKIQIFLNGVKVADAQSDDTGNFLSNITNLQSDKNVIQVKLLDGTDQIIGQSDQISVTVGASGPAFQSISFKEGTQVATNTQLNATVTAEPNLTEVLVTLNGVDQIFTADKGSDYVGTLTAPANAGDYPVKVKLTNSLGKITTKDSAMILKVIEPQPTDIFKNIKTEKTDKKVTFTFELVQDSDSIAKFEFKYGANVAASAQTGTVSLDTTNTNSGDTSSGNTSVTPAISTDTTTTTSAPTLDKVVTTFDKAKILKDGKYSWYIDNLDPADYTFELYALDKDGKELSLYNKATTDVDLSLDSAGKCSISNISGLKVMKNGDVSELSWDAVPEAKSYNVYKKAATGEWQFIENVATNKYTVNITGNKIVYEDFAIKGVCGDKENESIDYSNITKVQTGPGILILLTLSGVVGYFLVRKKIAR